MNNPQWHTHHGPTPLLSILRRAKKAATLEKTISTPSESLAFILHYAGLVLKAT